MTSASNFINVTYLLHGNPNDLRHLLSYPITTVPVSFDGRPTPLKTDKATLTKALESRQHVVFVDTNLPSIKATGLDQAQRQWNGAPQKRGIQGRVCQFPHDRMEEGPLWTSSWQQNDLHLTWWKMHDDAEQQRIWPGDHWAGQPSKSTRRSWHARCLSCKTSTWGKHTDKVDRHGCPGDSSWACRKISRK